MPKRRLRPRYLAERRNRDGTVRYYWTPSDQPSRRLPDDPEQAWLAAEAMNRRRDGERAGLARRRDGERAGLARRRGPAQGTIAWLIREYRADDEFERMKPKSQLEYGKHLDWLERIVGDLGPAAIDAAWVHAVKQKGRARPFQTNARIRVIRALWNWARRHGVLTGDNPAARFRQLHAPARDIVWSAGELGAFLKGARPSMRLAVLLGLYTLQREGDLIALPWHAYDGERIELRQGKTGRLVSARAHLEIKAALAATAKQAVTILVNESSGKPYTEHQFRYHFARDRELTGVRPTVQFRDLRRTGAVILARRGETLQAIAALGGWSIGRTAKILETYIPLDAEMADRAVARFEAGKVVELGK